MGQNKETSAVVDGILRACLVGTVVGTTLVFPGSIVALGKPATKLLDSLDDRDKERKIRKMIRYMKTQGLVSGDYDHGITLSKAGRKRLKNLSVNKLAINMPDKWDGKWRIVFFDIPETKRSARVALSRTLKGLGYQILQKSIWIYPYPSKSEIAKVCNHYGVSEWLTYIVTDSIDNEAELKKRFKTIM